MAANGQVDCPADMTRVQDYNTRLYDGHFYSTTALGHPPW